MKKELLEYVTENKRVCPMPGAWNKLWKMLPKREEIADGEWDYVLMPLICGWWDECSDKEKRERLITQINYAAEKGVLDRVDKYLRSPIRWHYAREHDEYFR